ncbi:Sec62/63 complex, subunit Sec66 [Rhexocercosporidium sp. MPI-PUGE-AT-0058]|nr:Sec62/63 complex, subunit Sec66 [Rhexocercosporidium sp. MPI-PUGE-AT-0058]
MFAIHWAGLVSPFLYIVVLSASVYSIYSLHRKFKAAKQATASPWLHPHLPRDVYLSLLHLEHTADHGSNSVSHVPRSMIIAALLRRAIEDIKRVGELRSKKHACASLLERRSVGNVLLHKSLFAETEMEDELRNVVEEANRLARNWGQTIFQTANEIVANEKLRTGLGDIQAKLADEKILIGTGTCT